MAYCQSCGMPLSLANYGTNASGTLNFEYCSMCFQKGGYTDSDLTFPQMIQIVANRIVGLDGAKQEEAQLKAKTLLSTLKRWKNAAI